MRQEANFHQTEPPLIEAEALLGTLLEAWAQCPAAAPAAVRWEAQEREIPEM